VSDAFAAPAFHPALTGLTVELRNPGSTVQRSTGTGAQNSMA
jgi:hypothetical protein